jgi:hypothetical protein
MKFRTFPLIATVTIGFATATLGFAAWAARPARAQIPGAGTIPQPGSGFIGSSTSTPALPQPLEIQALDAGHFVVATREPRLVAQIGREGAAQNMVVTVVTHYTVRGDRLIPVEHVRVPTGYQLITVEE